MIFVLNGWKYFSLKRIFKMWNLCGLETEMVCVVLNVVKIPPVWYYLHGIIVIPYFRHEILFIHLWLHFSLCFVYMYLFLHPLNFWLVLFSISEDS